MDRMLCTCTFRNSVPSLFLSLGPVCTGFWSLDQNCVELFRIKTMRLCEPTQFYW